MRYVKKFNEVLSATDFDIQFAIAKVKENFTKGKVDGMLNKEIKEWVDDDWSDNYESESEWYLKNNNGEAQESIIHIIVKWFINKYNNGVQLSDNENSEFIKAIKKEYKCLN